MQRIALYSALAIMLLCLLLPFQIARQAQRIQRSTPVAGEIEISRTRRAEVEEFCRDYVQRARAAKGATRERMHTRREIRRELIARFDWMNFWQIMYWVAVILSMLLL